MNTARLGRHAVGMHADDHRHQHRPHGRAEGAARHEDGARAVPPASWVALPIGGRRDGPSIADLVEAVRAAGGAVGGDALFDPRYEAEMRQFLIRALELEGIPVPRGGGRP